MKLPQFLPRTMGQALRPVVHPVGTIPDRPFLFYPQATIDKTDWITFGPSEESHQLPPEFFLRDLPQLTAGRAGVLEMIRTLGVPRVPVGLWPTAHPDTDEIDLSNELHWAHGGEKGIHYLEAKWGLLAVQAASASWCLFKADAKAELRIAAWTEAGFTAPGLPAPAVLEDPHPDIGAIWSIAELVASQTEGQAPAQKVDPDLFEAFSMFWMATVVGAGLQIFHPRIGFDQWTPDDSNRTDVNLVGIDFTVDLFEALCAQIASHIAIDASPKQCENEKCDTWFYRRVPQSPGGLSREKGIKYCSDRCARAQAERVGRRRRRQETREDTNKEVTDA